MENFLRYLRIIEDRFKDELNSKDVVKIDDPDFIINLSKSLKKFDEYLRRNKGGEEAKKLVSKFKKLRNESVAYFSIRMKKLLKRFNQFISDNKVDVDSVSGLYFNEKLFIKSTITIYKTIMDYVKKSLRSGEEINKKELYKEIIKRLARSYRIDVYFESPQVTNVTNVNIKKVLIRVVKTIDSKILIGNNKTIGPLEENDILTIIIDDDIKRRAIENLVKAGFIEIIDGNL